ncbi:MAG: hypothetical protein RLZZ282_1773, partial [Verrucomicrobiota bacterium]
RHFERSVVGENLLGIMGKSVELDSEAGIAGIQESWQMGMFRVSGDAVKMAADFSRVSGDRWKR